MVSEVYRGYTIVSVTFQGEKVPRPVMVYKIFSAWDYWHFTFALDFEMTIEEIKFLIDIMSRNNELSTGAFGIVEHIPDWDRKNNNASKSIQFALIDCINHDFLVLENDSTARIPDFVTVDREKEDYFDEILTQVTNVVAKHFGHE